MRRLTVIFLVSTFMNVSALQHVFFRFEQVISWDFIFIFVLDLFCCEVFFL